jgi:hypothetical protein
MEFLKSINQIMYESKSIILRFSIHNQYFPLPQNTD